ncbi:DNA translocase FtsK, partial [Candidatus Parcubacteria bacterium]|nr:DNA translocase FtsK [Candidatus Parcubacteria bacterium]
NIMGFWAGLIVLICLLLISLMLMFNTSLWALIGRESWLAKLFYPFTFVYAKIFKRDKEDEDEEDGEDDEEDDEDESDEDEENEEDEEDEEEEPSFVEATAGKEEEETKFHSHKIKEATISEEPLWQPTNIKIDLPLSLLNGKVGKPTSGDIKANVLIIQKTLENFGIPVEMGEVSVGPTVTQYTLRPAEGVKLSRITALNNDLSLALGLHPIRIEAPIPNEQLVGIEVPNKAKAIVSLKEILTVKDFKNRKGNLTIALGKDVSGKAWLDDLSKMPHLLVAGTTGAGKSVMLNSVIISLLYQNNPDDLRFIMVDPKRVELPRYNGIPYLLTPVITEVGKTINALKWCLNEMDRRFDVLSKFGKRNIDSYNKSSQYKMPYIVFIIDELADLMVAAARDIEAGVIRLAQMARAVGIHLVLATQRPSVDVITGLIKANMPARIAFSVASSIDSRTILDSQGAEKLLGRGDMLFITAEMSKPKRIQGAFVSDQEIKKIVHYIKGKGEPDYNEGILEKQKVHG